MFWLFDMPLSIFHHPLYLAVSVTIQPKHYAFHHTGIYCCILASCCFCYHLTLKKTLIPLLSLSTAALISFLRCCSGSLLSAGLHAALLTFFTASDLILGSLSPRSRSHDASLLRCVIWLCPASRTSSFHTRPAYVCCLGENTVGGTDVCK